MYKQIIYCCIAACAMLAASCSKVEYTQIENPAYLRVFNNLNYTVKLQNKDEQQPFLTMLIDPVMDKDGVPAGGAIMGDFLDQREKYAPPYPSHVGSNTSVNNPEYPGKENVLVGPVLNGFDLSSWAQVPSGRHRFLFLYRPKNSIPFPQLEARLRNIVLLDTVVELNAKEVYTMHVLQKNFRTKEKSILLRQENFHKLPLSDSLLYVNFYNMSSDGYWNAPAAEKGTEQSQVLISPGIRDNMNIYYSLFKGTDLNRSIPGYQDLYIASIQRNTDLGNVAPYHSIPLFADTASDGIHTEVWQRFAVLSPGLTPNNNPYNDNAENTYGNYGLFVCYKNGTVEDYRMARGAIVVPNMIVNIHSGTHNPRSFATVNTVEIVNGNVYLTTIQRKYAPPVY